MRHPFQLFNKAFRKREVLAAPCQTDLRHGLAQRRFRPDKGKETGGGRRLFPSLPGRDGFAGTRQDILIGQQRDIRLILP